MTSPITYKQAIQIVQEGLEDANIPNSEREAQLLVCLALDVSWGLLMAQPDAELWGEGKESLLKSLKRRCEGEPLAYIFERCEFFAMEFYVDQRVLIPRPETEILVEKALELIPEDEAVRVIDLGCGSGCIGLTVAKHRPKSEVLLIDKSPGAIEVAKKNAQLHGLEEQVRFRLQEVESVSGGLDKDWQQVDMILANPPYIAKNDSRIDWQVYKYEPHSALFADSDGLEWIHKWIPWSYHYLSPSGHALFEVGAGQANEVRKMIANSGMFSSRAYQDYQQIERVIHFRKV